jgi:predicted alpha/beta-hydrolase family hydrolase
VVTTTDRILDVDTTPGLARAHLALPGVVPPSGAVPGAAGVRGLLVLGHGAGGGIEAPDLVAATRAAVGLGWAVARVEQPWRVAGKRVAAAPPRLDEAWLPVLAALGREPGLRPDGAPLVVGGRSAGARVACRTATAVGATAVLCLAFPLHPPGRPERSRLDELALPAAAGLPVLAVQGRRDAFGTADELAAVAPDGVRVAAVDGDHGLKAGVSGAVHAVAAWLAQRR